MALLSPLSPSGKENKTSLYKLLHGGKGQDKVLQRQQAALTVWSAISSLKTNSSTVTEPEKDSSSPTGSGTSDGGWHDVPPDEWFASSEGNHSADVVLGIGVIPRCQRSSRARRHKTRKNRDWLKEDGSNRGFGFSGWQCPLHSQPLEDLLRKRQE